MRFTTVAIASTVVAVASAQALNPLYPFQPNGACIDACLIKIGKSMFDKFTTDPSSPDFMASLAFAHERGTPSYLKYMGDTGPCVMTCPASEQNLYLEQYNAKAAWYADKKAGGTGTPAGNGTTTAKPTASGGAQPTASTPAGSGAVAKSASAVVGVAALLSAAVLL